MLQNAETERERESARTPCATPLTAVGITFWRDGEIFKHLRKLKHPPGPTTLWAIRPYAAQHQAQGTCLRLLYRVSKSGETPPVIRCCWHSAYLFCKSFQHTTRWSGCWPPMVFLCKCSPLCLCHSQLSIFFDKKLCLKIHFASKQNWLNRIKNLFDSIFPALSSVPPHSTQWTP